MSIHSKGTTDGRHDAVVHVGIPSPAYTGKDWVRTNVYFHGFAAMPEVRGEFVCSRNFFCLGYEWGLKLFPRGDASVDDEDDNMISPISVFLQLKSSSTVKVEFGIVVKDFTSKTAGIIDAAGTAAVFSYGETWGYRKLMQRANVLASLVKGALVFEIRMKPVTNAPPVFIPTNPSTYKIIQDLFNEEEDADVAFLIGTTKKFYAHKLILNKAAPQLAELCMSDESQSPVHIEIPGISPFTFENLLLYIYGRPIPGFGKKPSSTKEIIEAADKYGVTNLKLEAEAYYVASLQITAENVLEQLHFADSMNCSLLKETVMDFIVANSFELLSMKALKGAPTDLLSDALAAMARKGGTDKAGSMFINELRRKCYDKGLDFDGSREMLTSALAGEDGNEAGVEAGQDGATDEEDDDDGDDDSEEDDDDSEEDDGEEVDEGADDQDEENE